MITSYDRGHKIIYLNKIWVYDNDHTPIANYGGKQKPCKKCGALFETNTPDQCLNVLPGVKNACCGHGVKAQAYIQFENGVTVRGFKKD